ncbi:MAG: 3'-5' exonuclease [Actinomycetota bacterium]|nr:3'-5' exonuclease [Actinomycetota bacterium]
MSLTAPVPDPGTSGSGTVRYAVVDVETTGLDAHVHRVLECAVVELDGDGLELDRWSSLVSVPGDGEPGASFVHGITRAMLAAAPTFPELLPELVRRLSGRVLVGHVLAFDLGHLAHEFALAGTRLPELGAGGICTRELARRHLPPGGRSLALCCAATGIAVHDAHTALGDALSAAGLLRWFIAQGFSGEWGDAVAAARATEWPDPGSGPDPSIPRRPPR